MNPHYALALFLASLVAQHQHQHVPKPPDHCQAIPSGWLQDGKIIYDYQGCTVYAPQVVTVGESPMDPKTPYRTITPFPPPQEAIPATQADPATLRSEVAALRKEVEQMRKDRRVPYRAGLDTACTFIETHVAP